MKIRRITNPVHAHDSESAACCDAISQQLSGLQVSGFTVLKLWDFAAELRHFQMYRIDNAGTMAQSLSHRSVNVAPT